MFQKNRLLKLAIFIFCFMIAVLVTKTDVHSTTGGNNQCGSSFVYKDETTPTFTYSGSYIIDNLYVKAGNNFFGLSSSNPTDGCYTAIGLGTTSISVSRTGNPGSNCQDISHVQFCGHPCPSTSPSPSPSLSPSPTPSVTPIPTPSVSPSVRPSPSPCPSVCPSTSPRPSPSPSPSASTNPSPSSSPSSSPETSPSANPSPSSSPETSPSTSPSASPEASSSPSSNDDDDDDDNDDSSTSSGGTGGAEVKSASTSTGEVLGATGSFSQNFNLFLMAAGFVTFAASVYAQTKKI